MICIDWFLFFYCSFLVRFIFSALNVFFILFLSASNRYGNSGSEPLVYFFFLSVRLYVSCGQSFLLSPHDAGYHYLSCFRASARSELFSLYSVQRVLCLVVLDTFVELHYRFVGRQLIPSARPQPYRQLSQAKLICILNINYDQLQYLHQYEKLSYTYHRQPNKNKEFFSCN